MKNRILAMLLCGCIILSMFPGNIMAEGNSNDENGTSIQNVGDDQRVLYLSSGSYNSNSNTFSSWGHYTDGMWVNYTGTGYYQLYYGIQNNYGDPVTVKNWSYTAPEGITGSSVTLTEKTDKNGVVFYEIAAQYMGDETCTGTLNITLSDGTETSFSISFQKPSQGWYTKPENTAANYLSGNTYLGANGEEKTLYYYYSNNNSPLSKVRILGDGDAVLGEYAADRAFTYDGATIDPTDFVSKGYVAVTATVSGSNKYVKLRLIFENGREISANCTFRVDPNLPSLWLRSGSYNSNNNTFSQRNSYSNSFNVSYTGTGYYQLYYGIQNNYGDPVTVKNWSYTAPEGITGSSVTLTEKTDKNGVVFYEIAAQYMGDETCTGTLNITLSDGTETSFSISFQKPSQGWYTKPENTAANYLSGNTYLGANGEEKTLYYFYSNNNSPLSKVRILGDGDAVLGEYAADKAFTYDGATIDPTDFASKGYVAVTATVSGSNKYVKFRLIFENGREISANCTFRVDPNLPVLWLRGGNYNSNNNTFSLWNNYNNSFSINYSSTRYYQLYYGIQNNYGDPVTIKNWSYTAPEGITGSSVTLTEKTDKNGVVFYEIAARYMGDETCTGMLNITLSDGTETSFSISFQKPSQGWYTKPENTAANYLSGNTYLGANGEEKTLYYYYSNSNSPLSKVRILGDGDAVLGEYAADKAFTYDGATIDPTDFASKGYVAVTATVSGSNKYVKFRLIFENGREISANCTFRVDPNLPNLWIKPGSYFRGNFNAYNPLESEVRDFGFYETHAMQFYYGTKDDLGKPVELESWSYTSPADTSETILTVTEFVDYDGNTGYILEGRYFGVEDCTGILTLTLADNQKVSLPIKFGKREESPDVYSQPKQEGRYFLKEGTIYGMPGEQKTVYYFPAQDKEYVQILVDKGKEGIMSTDAVEIPFNAVTVYELYEIDTTHLEKDGYVAITSVVSENVTDKQRVQLHFVDTKGKAISAIVRFRSDITNNYDHSGVVPVLTYQESVYTFGFGRSNGQTIRFAGQGTINRSWHNYDEYRTDKYIIGAHKRDGSIEYIASKDQFDKYILNVTLEIDENSAGQLMYYNGTSIDTDAFKMEVIKDDTADHPWSIAFSIKKEHLISVRVKINITVQMPGWDEPKTYSQWHVYGALKYDDETRREFIFDGSAYDTSEKLNELMALDREGFLNAFRKNSFEEYLAYLEVASQNPDIVLRLPAVEYDDVIYIESGTQWGALCKLEGTEQSGKKTTMCAMVLTSDPDSNFNVFVWVENIDFVAKDGIKVNRGNRELSCGIMAAHVSPRLTNVSFSGYEVGVYATYADITLCRFENNQIGYLLSNDEFDPNIVYDGSTNGYFRQNVRGNDFINNGIAIKVEELPKGATGIQMTYHSNNFIDNDRDMDMANGELGTMYYVYNNYFGWNILGVLTPRTALVELGKNTVVITNPRRWAPYGSGDDRLYVDVLYPGVTWIVNSQSSDLKIAEELIDTENDTELNVTDDQGKTVAKWKFEGGKKEK